jgi:hypothetical protein
MGDAGFPIDPASCTRICGRPTGVPGGYFCVAYKAGPDLTPVQCTLQCGVGRRPPGLEDVAMGSGVGDYFGSMARLEAASVDAFRILRRELSEHRLPRKLDRAMRRAARDEVRHARVARALGKRFGGRYEPPAIRAHARRSLREIAIDNAVEGCVRETYGALVAHLQMTRAGDADVRACMAAIADEETEHAALSWDIAEWIEAQLDEAQRAQLAGERRDAFATLARDLAMPVDPRVAHVSGVPAARDAVQMLEGLAPMMLAA